jgi:phospholipid N-methyltransferase
VRLLTRVAKIGPFTARFAEALLSRVTQFSPVVVIEYSPPCG